MTKKQFMEILDRTADAIADGGQGGIEDVLTISKVLGGCDIELMTATEREYFIFGAQAGFSVGADLCWYGRDWEEED